MPLLPKMSSAFVGSLIIIIIAITTSLGWVRPNPNVFQMSMHRLAINYYPGEGLNTQAQKTFTIILNDKRLKTTETLLEYGKFLKNIKSERADKILEEALQEQYELMNTKPEQPHPNRVAGQILTMLDRKDQARMEFQKSLEKDEFRLKTAQADYAKFAALRSMGETYLEMGDPQSALSRFKEAYQSTLDSRSRLLAQIWINKIEGKDRR